MAKENKPLSYAHLHAFVDKELVKQRCADVDDLIKSHPDLMIHIREYQIINNHLHTLYDIVMSEPVPDNLLTLVEGGNLHHQPEQKRRGKFWDNKLIVVITGMVCGGVIGVVFHFSYKINLLAKTLFAVKLIISRLM